jgi:hypothetical protein
MKGLPSSVYRLPFSIQGIHGDNCLVQRCKLPSVARLVDYEWGREISRGTNGRRKTEDGREETVEGV